MEKTICQLHRPMTMVCHDFICTFLHHQNFRILPSRTGLGLHKPTTTKSSNSVRSVKLQSVPKLDLFGTYSSYSSYYFIFVTHIFLLFPSSFSSDRCLACLPSFSLILLLGRLHFATMSGFSGQRRWTHANRASSGRHGANMCLAKHSLHLDCLDGSSDTMTTISPRNVDMIYVK